MSRRRICLVPDYKKKKINLSKNKKLISILNLLNALKRKLKSQEFFFFLRLNLIFCMFFLCLSFTQRIFMVYKNFYLPILQQIHSSSGKCGEVAAKTVMTSRNCLHCLFTTAKMVAVTVKILYLFCHS